VLGIDFSTGNPFSEEEIKPISEIMPESGLGPISEIMPETGLGERFFNSRCSHIHGTLN
jgi:hypothetical protein